MTFSSSLEWVATAIVTLFVLSPSTGSAQWLNHPTPGVPRLGDGKPNLSAPAPRTTDGRPDLSGLWEASTRFATDFTPADAKPWAQEDVRLRELNVAADSWAVLCLPAGPMVTFTGPFKIMQTPGMTAILYETTNNYRQIFTDGRELPQDPNPTWQGYSIGRWEGDTFVVETIGFNDRSRVGRPAYPHSEELRITERYHRRDFGHIDLQTTVEDPKAFTRPWAMTAELVLQPDTEMLEFVCNENEKDRQHFVSTGSGSTHVQVGIATLARYVGTYRVPGPPRGELLTATVSLEGDRLMIDVMGMGRGPLIPQTATSFLFRGAVLEFIADDQGEVTHVIAHAVEGDFKGARVR